jgi:hypothetical protein
MGQCSFWKARRLELLQSLGVVGSIPKESSEMSVSDGKSVATDVSIRVL